MLIEFISDTIQAIFDFILLGVVIIAVIAYKGADFTMGLTPWGQRRRAMKSNERLNREKIKYYKKLRRKMR
jgi:hypothetical protein